MRLELETGCPPIADRPMGHRIEVGREARRPRELLRHKEGRSPHKVLHRDYAWLTTNGSRGNPPDAITTVPQGLNQLEGNRKVRLRIAKTLISLFLLA